MKSYEELKAQKEEIEKEMLAAKKRGRIEALTKVFCKEFGFTARMLNGAVAEGRNKK